MHDDNFNHHTQNEQVFDCFVFMVKSIDEQCVTYLRFLVQRCSESYEINCYETEKNKRTNTNFFYEFMKHLLCVQLVHWVLCNIQSFHIMCDSFPFMPIPNIIQRPPVTKS